MAYGIWAALGVTLTAALAALLFGESLGPLVLAGIGLVVTGVLCVEVGSHRAARARGPPDGVVLPHRRDRHRGRRHALAAGRRHALAAGGRRTWYAAVAAGYVLAFTGLGLTLVHGMGLGAAYGIWAAAGVALTAAAGRVLFGDPLTWVMALGGALIMGGVLLLELGAAA